MRKLLPRVQRPFWETKQELWAKLNEHYPDITDVVNKVRRVFSEIEVREKRLGQEDKVYTRKIQPLNGLHLRGNWEKLDV